MPISRRDILRTAPAAAVGGLSPFIGPDLALAQAPGGVLRIGMTAASVPLPNGQTDQGGEGQRFMGYTVFDSLVFWDLSRSDAPSRLVPNLATSWEIDRADNTRWLFRIRPGVKFHDGSPFTAHAAQWNFEKILDNQAPHFDPRQSAQGRARIPTIVKTTALSDDVLEVRTRVPDALLPYGIAWIVMSSPAQWEKVGRSWDAFLNAPSGTGPFRCTAWSARERGELTANKEYWNEARRPRLDRVVLLPMPEANSRTAALRAGQVDWIEAPAPDAIPSLRQAGINIVTNEYPHVWVWHFSMDEGSPWRDVRVRRAANLAVDRDGIRELLGGLMQPAVGLLTPSSPWFGTPSFKIRHDVAEARRLMAEVGFTPQRPLQTKVLIPAQGSGMMQPIPMNEAIQQGLRAAGIAVTFEVVEWNALQAAWRAGSRDSASRGASAHNNSYFSQDPFTALIRHLDSSLVAPRGTNWGWYQVPEMDALFERIRTGFGEGEIDRAAAEAHAKIVDDALFLFVAHDLNARAMHRRVRGFVQARNWFQDLGPVSIG